MRIAVGGQAVMEGVMMRAKDHLAVAVRLPGGEIVVETGPWFTLLRHSWMKKPFIRGFPVLLETLVNGIKALNFSARQAMAEESEEELKPWALALTVAVSLFLAIFLFVVVPHLFSIGMQYLGFGGDVDALSFHLWDGLFKMSIFIGYVAAISYIPDIRRVFQYHGAEHKVIGAYEDGLELTPVTAKPYSRLHPRCGTAFLLVVISLSIFLYAFIVPFLLKFYTPAGAVFKHLYIVAVKMLLMIPISSISYEMIKFAGKHRKSGWCKAITLPGIAMQLLTTREPDDTQIEVAIAALKSALEAGGNLEGEQGDEDVCQA